MGGKRACGGMRNITGIREMQMETARKQRSPAVRTGTVKHTHDAKCWWGGRETGPPVRGWWAGKVAQPLWTTAWRFLRKLNRDLPRGPAVVPVGVDLSQRNGNHAHAKTPARLLLAASSEAAPDGKERKHVSLGEHS